MKSLALVCALLVVAQTTFSQPSKPQPSGGKDLIAAASSTVPQSTEIASVSMETWSTDTETKGVFAGNVVVIGTNLRITCDRLEITATGLEDKNAAMPTLEKFKFLVATGKVRIVQGDREATCGRAEVYPRENKVVLTESPMAIDHGSEFKWIGDKLVMLRGERRVMGDNVRVIMPPIKDLGFDKNAPVPKAEDEKAKASDGQKSAPGSAK